MTLRRIAASVLQTTTLLGFAAIVIGNLAAAYYIKDQEEKTIAEAQRSAANLNTAFEQYVVHTIKDIDLALQIARAEFERDPASFSVGELASRSYFPNDPVVTLAVLRTTSGVDLGERDDFRHLIANPRDEFFISKPVLDHASQRWTIQFTRRLRGPDDAFAGLLVASVAAEQLTRLYETIDIGTSGAISVIGTDGIIRARAGGRADAIGHDVGNRFLALSNEQGKIGTYQTASSIDGVDRIASFRKLADYPLLTTVALGREEVLMAFEEARISFVRNILLVDTALLAIIALGVIERYRFYSAQDKLASQASILESTFRNMRDGVIILDDDERVIQINNHALALLDPAMRMRALRADYALLPVAQWEHAGTVTGPDQCETTLADGRVLEIRTSSIPGGGWVKTISDITLRKKTQRALVDARDRAEAATRARTAFLATMSHEIRTPLGGILSMVDLMRTTTLDPTQKHYIDVTRESAEHLLQLINDVLDVTKLDADQVKLESISFDLHRQIRGVIDIVTNKAQEKGLAIGCYIAPDVPRQITADPGRIRQVLLNLLGNAIKFTAKGHVHLEVTRNQTGEGERLNFRIADTGIGISKTSLPQLFSDFTQVDSSISRRFGGTGLGLSISRKLVTRMGGTISVESTPGLGSTFHFDLPLHGYVENEKKAPVPAAVVVVTAEPFERDLIARQIKQAYTSVHAAASVVDATHWLNSKDDGRRILLVQSSVADELKETKLPQGMEKFLLCARQSLLETKASPSINYAGIVQTPVFLDTLRHDMMLRHVETSGNQIAAAKTDKALKGLKVLLAEDNATSQFAFLRILENLGAEVVGVGNGLEALERLRAQAFDLVLMDIMMPVLDGLEATREIRSLPRPACEVPIIALTAGAFVEDREAAFSAGMNGFTTKPITAQKLLDAIRAGGLALSTSPREESSTSDLPIIDRAVLDQLRTDLGGDHVYVALDIFMKDLKTRTAQIETTTDAHELRKQAHALKGSASSFGFARLAQAAEALEHAARAGDAAALPALRDALVSEAVNAPACLAEISHAG